ncbi:hypothetical protein [Mesorhizobium sp.]|uniref:hypothetical protein n=1 Tax=Mesorhizobium sp. TaxID=1871066 RepID=UPI0011FFC1A9|nr:hypothetical protein [Mesorhizobium sp.]TIO09498.1 MAG: hypothetical protein E5X88_09215 [Mesorhizobium sp.]TIO33940.1 MAG: hypothetical protein E5X89_14695 [Mesorhizobium sp.]TIP08110.1 MAG: hypothetical protein E5X73_33590 [Mesorhizobium sp.]
MARNDTRYEHGATKYPAKTDADASDQFSQEAAGNKKPAGGMGLTRSKGEVEDKTRQSEGQNPARQATPSAATQKTSGAGPSIAGRSKDAKTPKSGHQPGAYVKE